MIITNYKYDVISLLIHMYLYNANIINNNYNSFYGKIDYACTVWL